MDVFPDPLNEKEREPKRKRELTEENETSINSCINYNHLVILVIIIPCWSLLISCF